MNTSGIISDIQIMVHKVQQGPDVTDGIHGLWTHIPATSINFTFETVVEVTFYAVHDGERIYFAFEYHDPTYSTLDAYDSQTIIMDTDEDNSWDQIDGDLMDEVKSGWNIGGRNGIAYDRYMTYPTGDHDEDDGGTNNVIGSGKYNTSTGTYFFEASQEMDSDDDNHDVSLQEGDSLLALIGIFKDSEDSGIITTMTIESEFLDTQVPMITIHNPTQDQVTEFDTIDIVFSVNETCDWMGYELDGAINQTINGNFSLNGLSAGTHDLKLFANDTWGNMGVSEVSFSTGQISETETTETSEETTDTSSTSDTENSSTETVTSSTSESDPASDQTISEQTSFLMYNLTIGVFVLVAIPILRSKFHTC